MTGLEPVTSSLPRKCSTTELHRQKKRSVSHRIVSWSGRRGSNPPPSAWKADALPNELLPLSILYIRCNRSVVFSWWGEKDSNLRTPKRTDLQSVAVGHLAISPTSFEGVFKERSRRRDSNPRPADYKSAALPAELLRLLTFQKGVILNKHTITPLKKGVQM